MAVAISSGKSRIKNSIYLYLQNQSASTVAIRTTPVIYHTGIKLLLNYQRYSN